MNISNYFKLFKNIKIPKKQLIVLALLIIYLSISSALFSFFLQVGVELALGDVDTQKIQIFGLLFFLFSFFQMLSQYYKDIVIEKIFLSTSRELKSDLLRSLIASPLQDSEKFSMGDIITRLSEDAEDCCKYLSDIIIPFLEMALTMLFGIIYTFSKSFSFGLIGCVFIPILYLINSRLFSKVEKLSRKIQNNQSEFVTLVGEIKDNFDIIKIFGMEFKLNEKLKLILTARRNYIRRLSSSIGKTVSATEIIIPLLELLSLIYGVYLVKNGDLTSGVLIGIWNVMVSTVLYPATDMPRVISGLSSKNISYQRISDILSLENESRKHNEIVVGKVKCFTVKSLSFDYSAESQILKDVNLDVKIGDIVFIKGESGVGKSTFLKVLCGFYPPNKGMITGLREDGSVYDGNPSNMITYIGQTESLFTQTIYDNIMLNSSCVSQETFDYLASKLGVDDFVSKIKGGYQAIIGKDISLSKGQIQKLMILRGLLSEKPFIVFDEPFSALDQTSIEQVSQVFQEVSHMKGLIIVSHLHEGIEISTREIYLKGMKLYEE